MASSLWHAGDNEEISCRLLITDVGAATRDFDNTDGTGEFVVWVERGSGREYLQSNLLSVSATPHVFSLTWDGVKWDDGIDFVVPALVSGENMYVEKTLRWTGGEIAHVFQPEEHYITLADLDEIENQVIGPGEAFEPVFGG